MIMIPNYSNSDSIYAFSPTPRLYLVGNAEIAEVAVDPSVVHARHRPNSTFQPSPNTMTVGGKGGW